LPLDPVVQQLLERLEWELAQQPAGIGLSPEAAFPARAIRLRIPARRRTVLVIDDNEGLVALLERFLLAHAFSVVKASTGSDGLRIAQEIRPDAIVLDVLLPAMDGWEVLQTLRNDPRTAPAPVIICSVFNEPELAYSLGAAGLLRKPVRREDLLQTLLSLGLV
jgi:CheY-like chemotaxis protein